MTKIPSSVIGSRFTAPAGTGVAVACNVADAVAACVLVALGVGVSVTGANVGVAVAGGASVSVGITVGTGVRVGASILRRIASAFACASATTEVAASSPGVRVCADARPANARQTTSSATMMANFIVIAPAAI